jgi:hypothetical protein
VYKKFASAGLTFMSSFRYNQKSIHHSTLSQKMQTEQKKFHEFEKICFLSHAYNNTNAHI